MTGCAEEWLAFELSRLVDTEVCPIESNRFDLGLAVWVRLVVQPKVLFCRRLCFEIALQVHIDRTTKVAKECQNQTGKSRSIRRNVIVEEDIDCFFDFHLQFQRCARKLHIRSVDWKCLRLLWTNGRIELSLAPKLDIKNFAWICFFENENELHN